MLLNSRALLTPTPVDRAVRKAHRCARVAGRRERRSTRTCCRACTTPACPRVRTSAAGPAAPQDPQGCGPATSRSDQQRARASGSLVGLVVELVHVLRRYDDRVWRQAVAPQLRAHALDVGTSERLCVLRGRLRPLRPRLYALDAHCRTSTSRSFKNACDRRAAAM